jgi:hypothetical protein
LSKLIRVIGPLCKRDPGDSFLDRLLRWDRCEYPVLVNPVSQRHKTNSTLFGARDVPFPMPHSEERYEFEEDSYGEIPAIPEAETMDLASIMKRPFTPLSPLNPLNRQLKSTSEEASLDGSESSVPVPGTSGW